MPGFFAARGFRRSSTGRRLSTWVARTRTCWSKNSRPWHGSTHSRLLICCCALMARSRSDVPRVRPPRFGRTRASSTGERCRNHRKRPGETFDDLPIDHVGPPIARIVEQVVLAFWLEAALWHIARCRRRLFQSDVETKAYDQYRPAAVPRLLSCGRSAGGLRRVSPALIFARKRAQTKRPA